MEWGDKVEALEEIRAKGVKVKALDNMPPYRPDTAIYLRAYWDCNGERNHNGNLLFSGVSNWCAVYGVDISECWDVLRIADTGVRKWLHSRSNR